MDGGMGRMEGKKSLDNDNVPGDLDTDWNIVRKGIDVYRVTEERRTSSVTRLLGILGNPSYSYSSVFRQGRRRFCNNFCTLMSEQ